MKNLYFLLKLTLYGVVLVTFHCCTQNSVIDAEDASKMKNDMQLLESLGYDITGIIETDEYYMIHPDIIISKSRLDEYRYTPETRMQKDNIYGLLNEKNRYVLISDKNLKNDRNLEDIKDYLHYAINAWNNISNSGLKFYIDNVSSNAVDIQAAFDGDGPEALYIERPSAKGEYGKYVRINLSKFYNAIYKQGQGEYLLMHTLGHIAGFAHAITNTLTVNPQPGHITGTTIHDETSIMRTEKDIIGGSGTVYYWSGFSRWDLDAVRRVYPSKEATKNIVCKLSGAVVSSNKLSLYKTYEISANYSHPTCPAPQYSISISNTNIGYELKQIENGKVSVRFIKGGTYEVEVEILNSPDHVRFKREFTLPDPTPAITSIICTPQPEGADKNKLISDEIYQITALYSQVDCPNPQYNIYIENENGYKLNKVNNNTVAVQFSALGTYKVIVEITNAPIPTQFEKTYYVVEKKSWVKIQGPDTVVLGQEYDFNLNYSSSDCPDPQYIVTVKETTFNDPQYRINRNTNDNLTICFDQPGSYIVEASVKDHPEIKMGKYYVSIFWNFSNTLGNTYKVDSNGDKSVYMAKLFIENQNIEYRTILYAEIKLGTIGFAVKNGVKSKIILKESLNYKEIKTIILNKTTTKTEFIELPHIEDVNIKDISDIHITAPTDATVYIMPFYNKITFPTSFTKEYNPYIDE